MQRKPLYVLTLFFLLILAGCGGSGGTTDEPDEVVDPGPSDGLLSNIPAQSGPPGVATEVPFSVTADDPDVVAVSATSNDQDVVADENLSVTGGGADRALSITPSDLVGESATITLNAEDDSGDTDSVSFDFTVSGDAPSPPSGDGLFSEAPASVSNTGPDGFGFASAVSGDYAIIGAPFASEDTGTAYVLMRSGDTWVRMGQISAADAAPGDRFGFSVVMDDNYAIIGAPEADTDAGANAGAAYVFQLVGTTWVETDKIAPFGDGAGAQDRFGFSVSASGDFAVIGSYEDDNNGTNSGSAFVFERDFTRDTNGGLWTERATLRPADGAAEDRFGISVSMSGDTAVIGASDADQGTTQDAGAAYVFQRGESGSAWTEVTKLAADDAGFGDRFGRGVAVSGDYAIVGAYLDDNNGDESGSAYIFQRGADGWANVGQLTADDGAAGDLFGRNVTMNGSYALLSAYSSDSPQSNAGAVYVFELAGDSWTQTSKLSSPTPFDSARFGFSVALSDNNAVVGAYSDTANLNNAYVYGQ